MLKTGKRLAEINVRDIDFEPHKFNETPTISTEKKSPSKMERNVFL